MLVPVRVPTLRLDMLNGPQTVPRLSMRKQQKHNVEVNISPITQVVAS